MGPNSQRSRAAAPSSKNTSARARFSKGPPKKAKPKKSNNSNNAGNGNGNNGSGTNNNNNNNNNAQTPNRGGKGRQGNATTAARVIDKISNRVGQKQNEMPARSATKEETLQYLDKTKLDQLTLPEDIVRNITALLEHLGVKESGGGGTNNNNTKMKKKDQGTTVEPAESSVTASASLSAKAPAFVAKEEEDESYSTNSDNLSFNDDVFNVYGNDDDDDDDDVVQKQEATPPQQPQKEEPVLPKTEERTEEDEKKDEMVDDFEDVLKTPAFCHFTQRLSFSRPHAARACRAIADWDIPTDAAAATSSETTTATTLSQKSNEAIALAMDWLCLHLTEAELTQGFRTNKAPPNKKQQSAFVSKSGIPLVGAKGIKAIPHPSISVAKSITSDKEWTRSVRLQERIIGFVRLGFHHSEASKACQDQEDQESSEDETIRKPEKDAALPRLLSMLATQAVTINNAAAASSSSSNNKPLNSTDLEYASEERKQEREALEAIYDDQLEVQASKKDGMDRYTLRIILAERLKEPARTDECRLHVFLRRGYPVVDTPLLLFTNPSLPPSLLRRINDEMARKAKASLGSPVVFEIVTFLSESLQELQTEFIKEQRHKEFEAEQLRLRKQGGHKNVVVERVMDDAQIDGGHRQKAKRKGAQKSYNRTERLQMEEEEKKQRQEERIQRVKEEHTRVRGKLAKEVVSKREEEWIEQEAEKAARAAMNAAFNRGASVEEARTAAKKGRNESLKHNGVDVPPSDDEGKDQKSKEKDNTRKTPAVSKPTAKTSAKKPANKPAVTERLAETTEPTNQDVTQATPTTTAFMDRLRQMYDEAAKKKAAKAAGGSEDSRIDKTRDAIKGYHLTEAEGNTGDNDLGERRAPRPVAVPTGEMGEAMTDIISLQKDQPWLVSPEARVPVVAMERKALSPEQLRRRKDISKKLRADLERKRNQAHDWAKKNPNTKPQRGRKNIGFTPEKFHSMMTVRQR
jgi:hypothetical protein